MSSDLLRDNLLSAPETQVSHSLFPIIETWGEIPTSLQILEVLDKCIYGGLASGFFIAVLQVEYDMALTREGKIHEDNVEFAVLRKK